MPLPPQHLPLAPPVEERRAPESQTCSGQGIANNSVMRTHTYYASASPQCMLPRGSGRRRRVRNVKIPRWGCYYSLPTNAARKFHSAFNSIRQHFVLQHGRPHVRTLQREQCQQRKLHVVIATNTTKCSSMIFAVLEMAMWAWAHRQKAAKGSFRHNPS